MKINQEKTISHAAYLVIEEPLTIADIIIDKWSEPSAFRNVATMSARVDFDDEIIAVLKELSIYQYFVTYNNYMDSRFEIYNHKGEVYSHLTISKEFSLTGIRKDKQQTVKDKAINFIKNVPEVTYRHKAEEFLEFANKIIERKVQNHNDEVLRSTRDTISHEDLTPWTDKEASESIDPIHTKIKAAKEVLRGLEAELRSERVKVLQDFVDNHSSDYSPSVVTIIRDAITEGHVFNPSRFRNF